MAKYPGKDVVGPTMSGDKYRYEVRTTMPCHKNLKGTHTNESIKKAYSKAHNLLDFTVSRHIAGCNTCKSKGLKP